MNNDSPATEGRLRWQTATITAIAFQSARVKSFFFRLPEPFAFRAGQHVDVRLTAADGYQAERSYSIASPPGSSDTIELAIERLADGEVSSFFHEVAVVGDEIELRGPIGGYFIWSSTEGGPVVLAAGGSGVVPFISMIRHRQLAASHTPMLLIFSARTYEDLIYREELQPLHRENTGFQLVTAVTRTSAHEGDFSRRIDAEIIGLLLARLPASPKHVLVCGANPFVEAAATLFIEAGIAADMIRTERYGG